MHGLQIRANGFFIRYNDSDSHLRIRFLVNKSEDVFQVIKELNPVFEDLLHKNCIWKVQNDTYLREIERYGEKTMVDSETLFYYDSKMILDYLNLKNSFQKDETQLFFSLLSIDSFLDTFSLLISEKFSLLDNMQQNFKKEFGATKVLKSELDKHYRGLEKDISNAMNDSFHENFQIIVEKNQNIKPFVQSIKENLDINLNSFLSSHIHMMINRQYTSRQREYETLIYDHLYRYYKTCVFRKEMVFKKVNFENAINCTTDVNADLQSPALARILSRGSNLNKLYE